jgi:hypothetical protein
LGLYAIKLKQVVKGMGNEMLSGLKKQQLNKNKPGRFYFLPDLLIRGSIRIDYEFINISAYS